MLCREPGCPNIVQSIYRVKSKYCPKHKNRVTPSRRRYREKVRKLDRHKNLANWIFTNGSLKGKGYKRNDIYSVISQYRKKRYTYVLESGQYDPELLEQLLTKLRTEARDKTNDQRLAKKY